MADKNLFFTVGADIAPGSKAFDQLGRNAAKAMKGVEDSLDDTRTAGQKLADALNSELDGVEAAMRGTKEAADALGKALGPELAAKTDTVDIATKFQKLGLTVDDIKADADALADAIRRANAVSLSGVDGEVDKLGDSAKEAKDSLEQMGKADVTRLEEGAKRARGGVDEVSDSARGANSALANMVGNSAQDIGAVGGVAGSTGVAIGQMAEYFSDATLGGERMRDALKSMITVAGPILVLTAAVSAVSGAMEAQKQRAEQAAKTTEQFGEAMQGASDDGLGLADSLRESQSALREFDASTSLLGNFGTVLNDAGKAVPLLGHLFQDTSVDIVQALGDASQSMYGFASAIEGGAGTRATFKSDLEDFRDAGFITSDQFHALSQAVDEYGTSVDKARAAQQLFNVNADEANAILGELTAKADPLAQMTDTWKTLFDDMADGAIDTQAAADSVNALADKLGITQAEVIGLARQHLADQMKDNAKTTDDAAAAVDGLAGGFDDMSSSADKAATAADGLASSLDEVFGSGNDLNAVEDELVQNFDDLNARLAEADKGTDGYARTLDMSTQAGRDNRAAIRDQVGTIQDYTTKLIASGASNDVVKQKYSAARESLIAQAQQFGLTEDEAKAYIDQLGLTPKAVDTAVKLQGDEDAKARIQQVISRLGAIPDTTRAAVQASIDRGAYDLAWQQLDQLAKTRIATVRVQTTGGAPTSKITGNLAVTAHASGGTVGAGESMQLVGERGPELVKLPTGSQVSTAAQTRSMLSDVGGVVFAPVFNIHAGVGADPHAIQRVVVDALSRYVKTNGPGSIQRMLKL